jgi:hypothetical protein
MSNKYTTVKMSEITKDPTMRLDAKYWINKKNKKGRNKDEKPLILTKEMEVKNDK